MDDALVLREARSNAVPSVSVIKNWDNTTTKGYRGCLPDHVIVWNETMKREAEIYHDIPKSRLHICGVPFWDSYFHAGTIKNKDAFCSEYNLSTTKQTIYFAMTAPTHYRHNFKIIIEILNAVRGEQFTQPVQLLVRVHPFYVLSFGTQGRYSIQEIQEIEAEFGDLVSFSYPKVETVGSRELLSDSNQNALKEILTHSDLLVSVYSTQLVEGALFDLPLVNVSYHNWRDTDEPIGVISQFEHIQQIMQDGAITNCHDDRQLIEAIDQGLRNPEHLRENRRAMADKLVPPERRGKAANAIVDTFLELVK
jgi:CDP-glycerol glycerophosphotransferase (TagB/SpsB family)